MRPARWYYNGRNGEFTTEVAIRRAPAEDLYITLGGVDFADGSATFKLVVNPLVDWVWLGVHAAGLRHRHRPDARDGAGAGRRAGDRRRWRRRQGRGHGRRCCWCWAWACWAPNRALARHRRRDRHARRWPGSAPTCAACAPWAAAAAATCWRTAAPSAAAPRQFRQEIKAHAGAGQDPRGDHRHVRRALRRHARAGRPARQGFNRLAWALPYGLGAGRRRRAGLLRLAVLQDGTSATAGAARQAAQDRAITKDRDLEDGSRTSFRASTRERHRPTSPDSGRRSPPEAADSASPAGPSAPPGRCWPCCTACSGPACTPAPPW